jgi:hypothetical protein
MCGQEHNKRETLNIILGMKTKPRGKNQEKSHNVVTRQKHHETKLDVAKNKIGVRRAKKLAKVHWIHEALRELEKSRTVPKVNLKLLMRALL